MWVFVGQAGTAVAGLLGIKLLTHVLTPSEFGRLVLANTIVALIATSLFGPIGQGVMRFWAISRNRGELDTFYVVSDRYTRYAIYVSALPGLVLTALFGLAKGINNWSSLVTLSLIVGAISGWLSLRVSVFTAARKRRQIALLNIGKDLLRPAIAVLLILLVAPSASWGMIGYLIATATVLLLAERLYQQTVLETSPSALESSKARATTSGLSKEIVSYSWPFFVWGVFAWVHMSSDRWALQAFHGPEVVGPFAVVSQLALYPIVFSSGYLSTLFMPIAFQKAGDLSQDHLLASAKHVLLAMTGMFVCGAAVLIGMFALAHQPLLVAVSNERFATYSGLLPGLTASWALLYLGSMLASFGLLVNKPQYFIMPKIVTSITAVASTFYLSFRVGPSGVVWGLAFAGAIYACWTGMIALNILKHTNNLSEVIVPPWADGWEVIRRRVARVGTVIVRIHSDPDNKKIRVVSIFDTPHYKFIRDYMAESGTLKWSETDYYTYAQNNLNGNQSVRDFIALYHSIKDTNYAEGKYEGRLCLVYRRLPIGRYKLFDGIHRLAILAALGHVRIEVGVVAQEQHWLLRLIRKARR